jgi:hypothetical protein
VNTREGNTGKPSTKLANEAHMRPVTVGSNNSTRPKTISSPTFIKTFKEKLPLVKWGKSDGFHAPVADLLAIVDQGFPNNFLSFRVMSPILVENDVVPLNLNCPKNNSPKQRTDFMHLLEPSKGLKIRKIQPSTPSKPNLEYKRAIIILEAKRWAYRQIKAMLARLRAWKGQNFV